MDQWRMDDPSLYGDLSTGELMKTLMNLQLLAYDPVVSMAMRLLSSNQSVIRGPVMWVVQNLAFTHFCAGENLTEASHTLSHMWHRLRLQGILNFALEDAPDDASCDSHFISFLHSIRQTTQLPLESVSFACVKITAICPVPLLERISDLLRWQYMHPNFQLSWKEASLPLFASESPIFYMHNQPQPLSPEEEKSLLMAKRRLWQLCKEAQNVGIPLLVDAEYTSVQPAIDYLTYAAAVEFNKHGEGGTLVYGTMQAYLKDSFPRLKIAMDVASKRGIPLGIKLVRGAYLARESTLAASLKIPSPVHTCIEDTHECYNNSAAFMLEKAAAGHGSVVLATHNVDSGRAAAAKAFELGITNRDSRLQFGQLKGMAEGLSLGLVRAGFRVSKYLAYGPVEHLVPYLIRRAEENKGVVRNTLVERRCIRQELIRRLVKLLRVKV